MSTGGSMTHALFKKVQLDHVLDSILEGGGNPDDVYHCVTATYPTKNIHDFINLDCSELDTMSLKKLVMTT